MSLFVSLAYVRLTFLPHARSSQDHHRVYHYYDDDEIAVDVVSSATVALTQHIEYYF